MDPALNPQRDDLIVAMHCISLLEYRRDDLIKFEAHTLGVGALIGCTPRAVPIATCEDATSLVRHL